VVDYQGRREVVLLAALDNATGKDLPLPDAWEGVVTTQYTFDTLEAIIQAEREDAEGYVIRFASGLRVKVKGAEYVRLHRILTGVSARTIWECLSKGDDLQAMLDRVPDEFFRWVHSTAEGLRNDFAKIEATCRDEFTSLAHLAEDRKAFAAEAVRSDNRAVLFAMLDRKPHGHLIWKNLRPAADRPFVQDDAA
jgi:RNA ligase